MAFLALAEKLREDNVSDKFEAFGETLTIRSVFALPPAKRREKNIRTVWYQLSSPQIDFTRDDITKVQNI